MNAKRRILFILYGLLPILQISIMLQGNVENCFWIPLIFVSLIFPKLSDLSIAMCFGLLVKLIICHSLNAYHEGFFHKSFINDMRYFIAELSSLGVCLCFYSKVAQFARHFNIDMTKYQF